MTERELKKRLKKLSIVVIGIIIAIAVLLVYTLANQKAELSIYTNAGGYVNNLQALGLNEEEFKEYLSVFGVLADEKEEDLTLKMVTTFIENMYSIYEIQTDENGVKLYDADMVKKIAQEIRGSYLKNDTDSYDKEKNIYKVTEPEDKITYCTEIKEISKKEDKIEVIYNVAIMTKEQMGAYKTGQTIEFETHTLKATIMNNAEYRYAKYFLNSVEEI